MAEVRPHELTPNKHEAISGCLLGAAVGDVLGTPFSASSWADIARRLGSAGIRDFHPARRRPAGSITDKIQLMLFCADGVLRAHMRGVSRGLSNPPFMIHRSLVRWLRAQREPAREATALCRDGWLIADRRLWSRRMPDPVTVAALRATRAFSWPTDNDSQACGGLTRSAPCAFSDDPFETAAVAARVTHGHPVGYLSAGLFADILGRLWERHITLAEAARTSLARHGEEPGMQEVMPVIERVLALHEGGIRPTAEGIARLGEGRNAAEVLAIGLWCALAAEGFEDGVIAAVNHDGDSGSAGLIAGHFLGLIHGRQAIPARWLERLEHADLIEQVALDLVDVPQRNGFGQQNYDDEHRYPGY